MTPAPYCQTCQFPFKEMGACPRPQKSILHAYFSLLPYLIIIFYSITILLTRRQSQIKMFLVLAGAYMVGDKILKRIFQQQRPDQSCKTSYGMPSSHMVVMTAFCYQQIRHGSYKPFSKFSIFMLIISQGIARIQLNYHTLQQVIGGALFGLFFAVIFDYFWKKIINLQFIDRFFADIERQQQLTQKKQQQIKDEQYRQLKREYEQNEQKIQ